MTDVASIVLQRRLAGPRADALLESLAAELDRLAQDWTDHIAIL